MGVRLYRFVGPRNFRGKWFAMCDACHAKTKLPDAMYLLEFGEAAGTCSEYLCKTYGVKPKKKASIWDALKVGGDV